MEALKVQMTEQAIEENAESLFNTFASNRGQLTGKLCGEILLPFLKAQQHAPTKTFMTCLRWSSPWLLEPMIEYFEQTLRKEKDPQPIFDYLFGDSHGFSWIGIEIEFVNKKSDN